ncbi:MAG: RHS repeat domain-containing protein, partial [Thermoanaerobaculia bacterium]
MIEVTPNSLCVGLDPTPPQEPEIPGGCSATNETQWLDSVLGVVRRTETVGGASFVTDYTQYAFPRGEAGSLLSKLEPQTLTVVLYPATDKTGTGDQRRAKAVLFKCSPQIVAAPPGTTRSSVPGDRVGAALEERHFETDPNQTSGLSDATAPMCTGNVGTDKPFCGSKAMRVVQMDYDYDDTTHQEGNRRLDHSKTIYGASTCGACPYHQVDFSPTGTTDWENNGRHYTTETHTGTLGSDARTITTVWAPVNWTSGPPTNGVVLPNILNQRTTTQGSVRDEYFQFDTTSTPPTDFLKGTFVYDSVKGIAFINCRYDDGNGSVDKEFSRTLNTVPVPARTYCSDRYSIFPTVGTDGDMFGKAYTWQHGELLNARWINGAVGTSTFKLQDFVRDATTGWVTSSADTSGRTTSYTYDSLGRVNQVTPPAAAELKTWTCFESPTATTVYRASAKQTCPAPASNANAVTWQHVDYDGLGRFIRAQRKVSGVGTTNLAKRYNLFDGRGNPIFSSEWVACTSSPCQTNDEAVTTDINTTCFFSGANQTGRKRSSTAPGTWRACWDPFGRPQQIVGAKHSSLVTVDRTDGTGNIYSDTKEAATTWCVNATFSSFTTGACNAGAITPNPITTTQKDAFGRITQATPPNTSIENLAKYAYDVNGKLTCVKQGGTADMSNCTSNPSGQYRKFDYDMNGFLRSEITPERGSVTYDTIGSLGNVRAETQPGSISISRTFDFAGRLSEEDIPSGTKYVVHCYDGAATCADGSSGFAGGSYPGGKLTRRYGYNWIPLIGPVVDEKFTYSDGGGRLSQLDTIVGNGDLNSTTTQSWTYSNLGRVATHNNPRVSGTFPVAYSYTNGLPTTVSGNGTNVATSITYNPAAGLASWTSGSSPTVTTTITQDTSLLPRPSQIKAVKSGGTTLFDTGTYSYDSAGNVLSQSDGSYGGSWTYDAGSRLLSATQGTTRNFAYDAYGNVTQNGSSTFTMDAGLSNHIIAGGSTSTVSYDARGNLTNWNGDTMSY